jgi:hypothetical protein
MTVEITAVHLIAKVVVEVEATISCQPAPSGDGMHVYWETGMRLWAKQASGRAVAAAYADAYSDGSALCDGTAHAVVMTASVDPSGVPFKRGSAVVAMTAYAYYSWEDWNTGEYGSLGQSASTGWITVRLGK